MKQSDYLEENKQIIENLRKLPVFEPFEEAELRKLLSMSKIKKYKSGEIIIKEGTRDTYIYFLVNGKVRITKRGKEVAILQHRGDIFGEMGAIDSSPRSGSVYAEEDTVCIATDIFYIDNLTGNDKIAFGYVLYRIFTEILADRLRITTKELMKLKGKKSLKFW